MGRATGRNRFDLLRPIRRVAGRVEALQVRLLGRSALSVAFRTPVLLLHTIGRRSGAERSSPLAFHQDPDGSLLVVGGAGGQPRLPDWVANLRAAPRASVTVHPPRFSLDADALAGPQPHAAVHQLAPPWP